jgi:hypothetical protein
MFAAIAFATTWSHMVLAQSTVRSMEVTGANASEQPRKSTVPDVRVLVPPVRQHRTAASIAVPRTVAELAAELNDYYVATSEDWLHVDRPAGLPVDSIHTLVRARARQLAASVAWDTVRGKQADMGLMLLIRAADTARTKALLARRLAEPGLRVQDSAYTLMSVVTAYARQLWPADLTHAEQYTKQLDALSPKASYWQAQAHQTLTMIHYLRGHAAADVLTHMEHVVRAMGRMDYLVRRSYLSTPTSATWVTFGYAYAAATEVAQSLPNGVARLAVLNQHLRDQTQVPASLIALDSSWRGNDRGARAGFEWTIGETKTNGQQMPPLFGSIWRNVPDTTPHAMTFGDGHVHVVLRMGHCTQLTYGARMLERLQADVPELRVVLYCRNGGVWGNVFVSPAEEMAALRVRLDKEFHSKIPIAIWVGDKVKNNEGGFVPVRDTTADVFQPWSMTLIDKRGHFRPFIGNWIAGPGEAHALRVALIRRVMAEPASPPAAPVASTLSPQISGTVIATTSRAGRRS